MSREIQTELIGVIVTSHCRLAEEMLAAAEMIVGPLQNCKVICFKPAQPVDELIMLMEDAIKEVDQGKGVLILTDLFGGTPANISLSFQGPRVEVVCGMNLPMLLKLAGCRNGCSLSETASMVKEYGRRHISLAGEVLCRSVKTVSSP
ncbi:MAG: PTS sugar transporter subunit IIA [Syntrophobacteraceae bacterium]|nr:PTS sugar transporter subunit IIA [Deltaproteobacteria bacterium]